MTFVDKKNTIKVKKYAMNKKKTDLDVDNLFEESSKLNGIELYVDAP